MTRSPTACVLTGLVVYTLIGLVSMVTVSEATSCPSKTVSVMAYNTALTPSVNKYDERRLDIGRALKANSSDFMCLQEVWYEDDLKNITDTLSSEFPYHFSPLHAEVGKLREERTISFWERLYYWAMPGYSTQPCNVLRLTHLMTCLGLKCLSDPDVLSCMTTKCEHPLYRLSQNCRSCVSLSGPSVSTVWKKCGNPTEEFNRINRPGLLILSKTKLRGIKYVKFQKGSKVLIERGFIKAQMDNSRSVKFVCTHLSSLFPTYYEQRLPKFKSYLEQQTAEIEQLNSEFNESSHVLIGDINTGPARNESDGHPKLKGEFPEQYAKLVDLGYDNPYLENDGRCTYCPSNNPIIVGQDKSWGQKAIDAVLTSDVDSLSDTATRVMDTGDFQLSDHYGVRVDVCLP